MLKESRETTKEHTRAGLYLCADTLSHSRDDDRTPGILSGSFGVWRARAHPAHHTLSSPQPSGCASERPPPCLRHGVSRAADRVSESTSDRSLSLSHSEREQERSLLYGEGGPAARRRAKYYSPPHFFRSSLNRAATTEPQQRSPVCCVVGARW